MSEIKLKYPDSIYLFGPHNKDHDSLRYIGDPNLGKLRLDLSLFPIPNFETGGLDEDSWVNPPLRVSAIGILSTILGFGVWGATPTMGLGLRF